LLQKERRFFNTLLWPPFDVKDGKSLFSPTLLDALFESGPAHILLDKQNVIIENCSIKPFGAIQF